MITKSDLKQECIMKSLAKKDNKELFILVDVISGCVQYKIYDHSNTRWTERFWGDKALDSAMDALNKLDPLTWEECNEYGQYLKLKDKYEKYDELYL